MNPFAPLNPFTAVIAQLPVGAPDPSLSDRPVPLLADPTSAPASAPGLESMADAHTATDAIQSIDVSLSDVLGPYVPVFLVAFLVAVVATPIMRQVALRYDIVDRPNARKVHKQPIPYLGGAAIYLGWLAGVLVSYAWVTPHPMHLVDNLGDPWVAFPFGILLGATAIVATGLFDDVYSVSPRVKIGGQLIATAAIWLGGVGVTFVEHAVNVFQHYVIDVPVPGLVVYAMAVALIAALVIGGCNALNLLDGLDGLAAGVSAISVMGFLAIAAILSVRTMESFPAEALIAGGVDSPRIFSDPVRMVMCMAILGAVLGFLPYNFNPAAIFMGDAGSLLLGFLCMATILLFGFDQPNALLLFTACLIVFAVPITDTSLAIFRRKMQGKKLSDPDKQHIHHLLRHAGFSVKQSVLILYGFAAVFAALGVSMVALDLQWRYLLAAAMVLYGFIFVTAYKVGMRYARRHEKERLAAEAAAATTAARSTDLPAASETGGAGAARSVDALSNDHNRREGTAADHPNAERESVGTV